MFVICFIDWYEPSKLPLFRTFSIRGFIILSCSHCLAFYSSSIFSSLICAETNYLETFSSNTLLLLYLCGCNVVDAGSGAERKPLKSGELIILCLVWFPCDRSHWILLSVILKSQSASSHLMLSVISCSMGDRGASRPGGAKRFLSFPRLVPPRGVSRSNPSLRSLIVNCLLVSLVKMAVEQRACEAKRSGALAGYRPLANLFSKIVLQTIWCGTLWL